MAKSFLRDESAKERNDKPSGMYAASSDPGPPQAILRFTPITAGLTVILSSLRAPKAQEWQMPLFKRITTLYLANYPMFSLPDFTAISISLNILVSPVLSAPAGSNTFLLQIPGSVFEHSLTTITF